MARQVLALLLVLALVLMSSQAFAAFSVTDWFTGSAKAVAPSKAAQQPSAEKESFYAKEQPLEAAEKSGPSAGDSADKNPSVSKGELAGSLTSAEPQLKNPSSPEKQPLFEIVDEQQIKLIGGSSSSTVCFDPAAKVVTFVGSAQPASPTYEFRTSRGDCNGDGDVTRQDAGISVKCNFGHQMYASCTDGSIVNYGGQCRIGNRMESLRPGERGVTEGTPGYTNSWRSLPTIESVFLSCGGGVSAEKSIWLTCMREG
ncbi:hypothetical protein HYX10_00060 [Candidatus Woesearchaeota archaeon]|nr:hypothetical protein [Candidatus Woesearchaeota archaeon]